MVLSQFAFFDAPSIIRTYSAIFCYTKGIKLRFFWYCYSLRRVFMHRFEPTRWRKSHYYHLWYYFSLKYIVHLIGSNYLFAYQLFELQRLCYKIYFYKRQTRNKEKSTYFKVLSMPDCNKLTYCYSFRLMVRVAGIEPVLLTELDPKSSASASSAIPASFENAGISRIFI